MASASTVFGTLLIRNVFKEISVPMGRYGYMKQNLRYADIRLSTVNPHCANSLLIISNIKRGDKGALYKGLEGGI